MRWLREVSLLFLTFTATDSVTRSANFLRHKDKRLTTTAVTKTLAIDTPQLCVNHCLATDGCLAVNFVSSSRTICELTSGVTNMNSLVDDHSSDLYVVDKCRYQGDRCDTCTERFQGDDCDTCGPGYYGDTCDHVFVEHLGHNCLGGNDLQITPGNNAEEIEACKEVCAHNELYGGFVVYNRLCIFKPPHCKNYVVSESIVDLYLKETVEV